MKKAFIIAGVISGSAIGLVLIAVLVVIHMVFTPARLTPIARQAADKFITCSYEIGEVDLTFFSTFPRFGLRADGLVLINPKAGAPNDTVVQARHLTATVDVMEFIQHQHLHVHEAILDDASVHFFIAPDGTTNLTDVFVSSPDTTEEDTTAFSLPFHSLQVDGLRLRANGITFDDAKDTIEASIGTTELVARAESWDDMYIALDAQDVCARLKGEPYADSLHVELTAPMAMHLDSMHFALDGARLAVNGFTVRMEGDVTLGDAITMDVALRTDKWQIQPLLALVPAKFTEALKDLDVDGRLQLDATAKGTYSETQMPLVNAHVELTDGQGAYKPLPYTLRDLTLKADAALNLNKGQRSQLTLHQLSAKTKDSKVAAKGKVDDLLNDMRLDMQLDLDAHLPDFAYFMPAPMDLTGKAKGQVSANIRLADLTEMKLEKGRIQAELDLKDLHYAMDSIVADLPKTHLRVRLPNPSPSQPKVTWVRVDMETDKADVEMATPLSAHLKASTIQLEAGNVLSKDPVLYAAVGLQTSRPIEVQMDSMGGTIDAPQLTAYAEYNTRDTAVMPVVRASLACDGIEGFYQDIQATLEESQLSASLSGGRKDKSAPRLKATLQTKGLQTRMGEELSAKTGTLALEAAARYKADGQNMLLKWNPRLKIDLKNGELNMPERLPEAVYIPSIEFSYSNKEMTIDNSRIELGNSDLNLKGQVRNIGKWFRHEAVMEGELDVVSNHCDANQLLAWFSSDNGSEEKEPTPAQEGGKETAPAAEAEANPFLVPTDVNLALNTHIREVDIFNQNAKNLQGGIYVKNGELILDEVGFVCRAAKLQLTAMYKSPWRDHLYIGFDYHMIDVDIDELLSMIPDLEQMVPMLSSFKGAAQFHLAAETYLNESYQPKMSTLRGGASLTGKDLVVLDGETFSKISKLLMFKKKTENKIDSINAELTVYKNQIDIYPLCVQMDNYMVALGGRHKTDMTFDYDINVLSPIYLGVHVGGNMDNLQIKLAKCKFAKDFKPHWYQKADTESLEIRRKIKESMEKNVRIK